MISWNKTIVLLSILSIHGAHSASPFDKFGTRELKEQHDEVVKKIGVWRKRQEDAIPKHLMTQERQEIVKLTKAASARVRALQQQQRVLDGQRIHAEAHLANIRRQLATCETNLRATTKTRDELDKSSNEWRQRSTSETANRKLASLERRLSEIEAAFYRKPLHERWHYPLHNT